MHNGLGDVGLWLAVFFPCLPFVVETWTTRNAKEPEYFRVTKNESLNLLVGLIVGLSSWWTFGAVLCSPGVVLQLGFHFDFGTALFVGAEIGMVTALVSGVSFLWLDSRHVVSKSRNTAETVKDYATTTVASEA